MPLDHVLVTFIRMFLVIDDLDSRIISVYHLGALPGLKEWMENFLFAKYFPCIGRVNIV